ncbi:hypothetical protein FA15DRAFT_674126 [Coprinopsis marcescibilis]|uniref:Ubiquitin-like domain-containing protein n=1 Tax=Coprinopsis marcescibilis TaxID=230819 RepID=A0A5C3KIQ9_COPMA|nr:hypothetical protein FA15DRAFT_674126 [Coprinopsis marcescibilis]
MDNANLLTLNMNKEIKVQDLRYIVQDKIKCSYEFLQIHHQDTLLSDNNRRIGDYGIENGSTLRLSLRMANGASMERYMGRYDIQVKTLTGATHNVRVDETLDVSDVQVFLWLRGEVAPDLQRFVWQGKQLVRGRTLKHYGIGPGSVLHLVYKLRGGGFLNEHPGAFLVVEHPWSGDMQVCTYEVDWRLIEETWLSVETWYVQDGCVVRTKIVRKVWSQYLTSKYSGSTRNLYTTSLKQRQQRH